MQRQFLQNYTKDPCHWGQSSLPVLSNFMAYLQLCQDPLHIIQYMQEKSICTFLPQFWLRKAGLYFEEGDYERAYECLQQAESRQEMSRGEGEGCEAGEEVDIERARLEFRSRMKEEMRKFPVRSKRSVELVPLTANSGEPSEEGSIERLINIYKANYKGMREERKEMAVRAKEGLPRSWMYEHYEQLSEKEREVEEMIASQSNAQHHFISTPNNRLKFSKKISKTVDSVELLKKKNTIEKSIRLVDREGEGGFDHRLQAIDCNPPPLTEIKRRVTFDPTFTKQAHIRSNIDRPKLPRFASFTNLPPGPLSQQ